MELSHAAMPSSGYVLVDGDALPEHWRARAHPMFLVALLPAEVEMAFSGAAIRAQLTEDEEELARLVAAGRSAREIASYLHVAVRTVERRMATLRKRLGVGSTLELVAVLAEHGFAQPPASVSAVPVSA
jgi:DNA-binding NarL/FixJ family response regulator